MGFAAGDAAAQHVTLGAFGKTLRQNLPQRSP
ncbi:hypothetical protein MED193_16544 [Roseobacter sp. MED193]|nr:hypothetical protein MED193_16544 [Roseobacter sp. MED193]